MTARTARRSRYALAAVAVTAAIAIAVAVLAFALPGVCRTHSNRSGIHDD